MKTIFMSLLLLVSSFFSSVSVAQKSSVDCNKATKQYIVYIACVSGTSARPLMFSIEISTLMTPYACGTMNYSRSANLVVTDQDGKLINAFVIHQMHYMFDVKPASGTYFTSLYYDINLRNCLARQGDEQGGFTIGN